MTDSVFGVLQGPVERTRKSYHCRQKKDDKIISYDKI